MQLALGLGAAAAAAVAPASAPPTSPGQFVQLATFDEHAKGFLKWAERNDPVMGGQSYGNWSILNPANGSAADGPFGRFQGVTKIVPFLKAPGFCSVNTAQLFKVDASSTLTSDVGGGIELVVRSSTPEYAGFKIAIGAIGVPLHSGGHEVLGSYKANFTLPAQSSYPQFDTVHIPWNMFSWDWSDFTGNCFTKDPTGYQHQCCSDGEKYCPNAKTLSQIVSIELWAEGVEGEFTLDIEQINARDCIGKSC